MCDCEEAERRIAVARARNAASDRLFNQQFVDKFSRKIHFAGAAFPPALAAASPREGDASDKSSELSGLDDVQRDAL